MFGHRFTHDHTVLVIIAICERIGRIYPFKFDRFNVGKIAGCHGSLS